MPKDDKGDGRSTNSTGSVLSLVHVTLQEGGVLAVSSSEFLKNGTNHFARLRRKKKTTNQQLRNSKQSKNSKICSGDMESEQITTRKEQDEKNNILHTT